jgi:hypothetical protein
MLAIGINTEDQLFVISREFDMKAHYGLTPQYVSDVMKGEGGCVFDRILLVQNDEVIEDWELDTDYT